MLPIILSFYYAQILQGNITESTIKDYIVVEAIAYGVDPQMALGIAEAESKFNPKASGDSSKSNGLWQIHQPSHPTVTKKQAQDIVFSTNWALKEMKENGCKIWSTCKAVMNKISKDSS